MTADQPPTGSPDSGRPANPLPQGSQALLTSHAAIVLLVAVVLGTVTGVLTYLSAGNTAGALLAGLTATCGSAPVLNRQIGD
ncbi:hypothetical protein [Streptomyces sp. NPDC057540]|uniref:hypothetical protein n=1 Tax=Streptomyces sp. NPDC057540 TaxID=3346160 RepID=UPI0036AC9B50